MNDLSGINWTQQNGKGNPPPNQSGAFSTLKPTPPASGRTTPLPLSKPVTPANDSFSNLVNFSGAGSKNLSIQEQQKRLADLKLGQHGGQTKGQSSLDDSFWNNLGSGRSTPAPSAAPAGPKDGTASSKPTVEEEDIFAAFNQPATLSRTSSHAAQTGFQEEDDDDPFGLSEFSKRAALPKAAKVQAEIDDNDVLGLLGQAPSTVQKTQNTPKILSMTNEEAHPQDKAVAELMDMGFATDKARMALEATETGVDVQAAVGILLNEAHAQTRAQQKSQPQANNTNGDHTIESRSGARRRGSGRPEARSSRFTDDDDPDLTQRRQQRSEDKTEKDLEQRAAEFGTNFLKTANSLWKQGSKRVQQAVQEFNSDSDSSQPKWLRGSTPDPPHQHRREDADVPHRRRRSSAAEKKQSATDEAMMLEAARPTPPPRPSTRSKVGPPADIGHEHSRDHSPVVPSRLRDTQPAQKPAFLRDQPPQRPSSQSQPSSIRAALNRQALDDQASQMYVSSARRRKPASQPPSAVPEADLLEGSTTTSLPSKAPSIPVKPMSMASRPSKIIPTVVRPPVPARAIPIVSAIAMKAAQAGLIAGNAASERGDYASAQQAYTTALSHLPRTHPIAIAVLTFRSSTSLKIGDPKQAITDSDTTMTLIGSSKGDSESIDLLNGTSPQPMRDYYGKALMQKAEALESLEKWSDAAQTWREAVELGHGGLTAIQARTRCERHVNPPARTPVAPVRKAAPTKASQKASAEAVSRLRAANLAAERADDEKFRLTDSVEARITAWKGGKADNLRALLSSLDIVLWPEANWKKISMADLVLPGKVKVQYMKGIAKVHPDKIPTDATTEQRMIAGSVFSTLNEAWDKFKTENNL